MNMRAVLGRAVAAFVILAIAIGGLLPTDTGQLRPAAAQTGIALNALCVSQHTGIVSAPRPITSTTCPANHFALLIPDSFPFSLSISPYTNALYSLPNPPANWRTLDFPDAGIVDLCLSRYTYQLRAFRGGCPDGYLAVQIVGQTAPDAVDDGPYTVLVGGTLTLMTSDPNDLLDNDDLGLPDATIASFGGGDAPGDVTTTAAGSGVAFAGGTLQVNADGSFSLTSPTTAGDYTFLYRLENPAGFDDATVTIQVQELPVAVDDGLYTTLEGQTLTVTTADPDDLLDNDSLGFPPGAIVSFGGGSLPGDASTNAAGTSVALAGGTLQVNGDGSFSLTNPTTGGQYSFLYRLENVAGFSDATVTIEVQRPPSAVDDGPYTMTVNTTLTVTTADPDDLLDNDDTGSPVTGVDSFGGGDAPGTVTTNAAGASVAFAGGTLTVNANGSFSVTNPTVTGSFTFLYRLENSAGFDDATVTVEIQGPPTANDDGPGMTSTPGDLFHTAFNTTLDSTATAGDDNLLSNDDRGFPLADITSFGGGDLGGTVTTNSAGTTVTPLPGESDGSLTVNADGSFSFTPATGFTGPYTFNYRLTNGAGTSDATVTIAVGERPAATNDSYSPTILGNVSIDTTTSTSFSVLTNDDGDGLTITTFDATSVQGGEVSVNADGTFTYDPPAGYEGSDSFSYTIDNGFSDAQVGTVSLTVSGMVWFIDQSAAAGGDGRLSGPFNCLVSATCFSTLAADEAGDSIFLASGAYTGGLTLLNNQLFIGEGASASITAITGLTPPADSPALPTTGGGSPQITTSNADALTLGSGNLLRGLTVGNTGTGTGIVGTSFGTLTLSEVTISGTGQALNLETGTATATFLSVTANGGGTQGMRFDGVSGSVTVTSGVDIDNPSGDGILINASPATFSFGGATFAVDGAGGNGINLTGSNGAVSFSSIDLDTITSVGLRIVNNSSSVTVTAGTIGAGNDPGGNAVDIEGGSATISIGASVRKTTAGEVVDITNRTGSTVTVSNTVTCNSSCTGVNVSNNTSGTTRFTGSVTTNTGGNTAVNLTTNSSHTVTFSGGLDIDTTSGVGFNATGGGTVEVVATGVTNTVDSTTGTAVNIASTTIGANGVTFESVSSNGGANPGIVLNSTGTLGGLTVTGDGVTNGSGGTIENQTGDGVNLNNTSNVSFSYMDISNNSANGVFGTLVDGFSLTSSTLAQNGDAVNEGALRFGTTTTNGVSGTVTLDDVTLTNSAEHNVEIFGSGSGTVDITIRDSTIGSLTGPLGADGFLYDALSTSSQTITINVIGTTFSDNASDAIQVVANGTSDVTLTVTGSTFRNGARAMNLAAATDGDLTFDISNNVEFTNFSPTLGEEIINIAGTSTTTTASELRGMILNNTNVTNSGAFVGIDLRGDVDAAIRIEDNVATGMNREIICVITGDAAGDAAALDLTILGNTGSASDDGFYIEALESTTIRADIANNDITASGGDAVVLDNLDAPASTFELVGTEADATTQITTTNTLNGGATFIDDANITIIAGPIDTPS